MKNMGCMPVMLTVLSSGFRFDDSNYNYDNTNTNVSSHLNLLNGINRAHMAKNNTIKRVLVAQAKMIG